MMNLITQNQKENQCLDQMKFKFAFIIDQFDKSKATHLFVCTKIKWFLLVHIIYLVAIVSFQVKSCLLFKTLKWFYLNYFSDNQLHN